MLAYRSHRGDPSTHQFVNNGNGLIGNIYERNLDKFKLSAVQEEHLSGFGGVAKRNGVDYINEPRWRNGRFVEDLPMMSNYDRELRHMHPVSKPFHIFGAKRNKDLIGSVSTVYPPSDKLSIASAV